MSLSSVDIEKEYVIKTVKSEDDELVHFLFSLGCFSGEKVTVMKKGKNNMVLAIKDGRYNIDMQIADSIEVCA